MYVLAITISDNTRYGDGGLFGAIMGGRQSRGEAVTVDDDYKVLRQALWSETDDAYKNAIEKLEAKKSVSATKYRQRSPCRFFERTTCHRL